MKISVAFVFFILIFSCAPTLKTTGRNDIPNGITYKDADSATNAKAFNKLNSALADSSSTISWFDGGMGCMPFLWKQLSSNPYFADAGGAEMTIMVPFGGEVRTFKGKSFRRKADLDSLQSFLVQTIRNDAPYVIRKPSPRELNLYWAFISFDIEEPVFVIESRSHLFLVDFYKDHILQIDDYYGVSLR